MSDKPMSLEDKILKDDSTRAEFSQILVLRRTADALETIAQRLDLASHGMATQLSAVEELAEIRLKALREARNLAVTLGGGADTVASIRALLDVVLP